ncbi:SNF2 domain-containing protein CLASSY 2-like [Vigna unguiculata]|uniref:DNA repair and recombination protein RAD54 and RAD54-like protein n=1 Tax=Vigna unguiculata TaxID=3917 RepID=A0A4D6MMM1_VIGUN|nr:SNF2 domain-containing protein CLASSY 2-like [Vigna unguiculata]XP_027941487.1 SNF2 domain-containing protein CLASSY 2-like [Vigna unguiculata]QCE01379.1 DNA repair and recombination protein RAD54 and RAD54-like protein [Vigna unguiculata]
MVNRKRRLDQIKHPFNSHPFEAVSSGSWQAVEFIKIEAGTMYIHFVDNHYMPMEKGPLSDIRIRSRKATLSDCSRFLRPGIDICVLSTPQRSNDSDATVVDPVWIDAKISSVQRKPHDSECSCQFYVNFYVHQGSLGAELRTLSKEIKVIGLKQISILQKLDNIYCEDQHYRWASSEDCSMISHTKLLLGKVLCDLSWLVVTSVVKRISFCVRCLEEKLVYQILGRDTDSTSLNQDSYIDVVNFKTESGVLVPFVSQVPTVITKQIDNVHECHEDQLLLLPYNVEGLRRSKRRNVQPERYIGSVNVSSEIDVGSFRNRPPVKIDTWKEQDDEELHIPLACLFGLVKNSPEGVNENHEKKASTCRELVMYKRRMNTNQEIKSGENYQNEDQNRLAIVPLPDQVDPLLVEHCDDLDDKVTRSYGHESPEHYSKYYDLTSAPKKSKKKDDNLLAFETQNHPAESDDVEKADDLSLRYHYSYGVPKSKRKNLSGLDDIVDLGNKWEGIRSNKEAQKKKFHASYSRSRDHGEEKRYNYKDRTLNAAAYKDLINSYLKNINTISTQEEPSITDQWKEINTTSSIGQKTETENPDEEDAEEESEMDMLWRELEVSLASSYLEEDSNAAIINETEEKPNQGCPHEFRMNEQIGIYCYRCGFVKTEIKYITPPFIQHSSWHQEEKHSAEEDSRTKVDEDDDLDLFPTIESPEGPVSQENDNVWALIPELRVKLHAHQKKAFEFLWQNIAGSMEPTLMEAASKKIGGCVVSHTPGAGKTFLIIAFLVSYLKLFPGKRPLVLAPKTTLYTWYKEFIKWDIPIPVYLIHGRRTYRVFKQKSPVVLPGVPKPTDDVKHVLDCLEKIQKWHSHPSVLIMGYTSFLTLMREDSKFAHRKYMAKVLRESPGIMVLDEGHNPRSTKSRLRKVLMKVQTKLRILLSGTLFQNNFCEYFNTLCLARPKFIHEVLKALDSKYRRKGKVAKKASHLLESRARKFFLDKIAKKIDSDKGRERQQGLKMLRNVTNGFIDVYEGGSSDGLPGLQIYTLLMNSSDTQHEILLKLHKKMAKCNGYPLELELMITLGSIHPWLVKTAVCAEKFFTSEQLMELEKCKFDLKIGSKVRFVLSLIYRVVKNEKVLIFCHNIAPVKLFVEYFEKYFGWMRGKEVLVLTGELELFERGRVMDKFEEAGGVAKILLASITACAEGISLTAASRVIMLDSEWNPSKTKQAIARAFRPGQQKVVYVYQLLVTGSLEEDKYRRTTWKEWVSSMIFSEAFVEDPSQWQAEKIEDDILREMVAEDKSKSFHMIMKNEKASSTNK